MAPPDPPRRDRRDSPIFRAFAAVQRVYRAEGDLIVATRETVEAHAAGACLTCGAPVAEAGAKLCEQCAADVAEAGVEMGVRAAMPVAEAFLRTVLGKGPRLPPAR